MVSTSGHKCFDPSPSKRWSPSPSPSTGAGRGDWQLMKRIPAQIPDPQKPFDFKLLSVTQHWGTTRTTLGGCANSHPPRDVEISGITGRKACPCLEWGRPSPGEGLQEAEIFPAASHSLTHSLTDSFSHSFIHSFTHSFIHSLTPSFIQISDTRSGVCHTVVSD